jgi:hypothetical protein
MEWIRFQCTEMKRSQVGLKTESITKSLHRDLRRIVGRIFLQDDFREASVGSEGTNEATLESLCFVEGG